FFQVPNPSCGVSTCNFNFTYGSSSIAANLVQDTVTLATDPIPIYKFGCVSKTTGTSIPSHHKPKKIKYTPLLKNPRRSSLYYVNLQAIRVGRRIVDIPPAALAFNPTTGAGTIFDSGNILLPNRH
ncbi:aspartic proteinase nepenthesin-1-like protein, partial [Trifolium pratense]